MAAKCCCSRCEDYSQEPVAAVYRYCWATAPNPYFFFVFVFRLGFSAWILTFELSEPFFGEAYDPVLFAFVGGLEEWVFLHSAEECWGVEVAAFAVAGGVTCVDGDLHFVDCRHF
ncbi:MAG: hypothetical protein RIS47_279 [Bacteroidota bacterium]